MPPKRPIGLARRVLPPMLPLALATCMTTTGIDATDAHRAATLVACTTFAPISWSTRDTDETVRQVKGHNAAYAETCK